MSSHLFCQPWPELLLPNILRYASDMASVACFCGEAFESVNLLTHHADTRDHRFMCSCGVLFKTHTSTLLHQGAVSHISESYIEHPALRENGSLKKNGPGHTTTDNPFQSPPLRKPEQLHPTMANECNLCWRNNDRDEVFASEMALAVHKETSHLRCPICSKMFHGSRDDRVPASARLAEHQKRAGHCYCAEHDQQYRTNEDLKLHLTNDHKMGLQCVYCDRRFDKADFGTHLLECTAVPFDDSDGGMWLDGFG